MENNYRDNMIAAFESAMIDAGQHVGGKECIELFDIASRNAGWYAERKNEPYYHRRLGETRTLDEWREYWHAMEGEMPFRHWMCINLARASYNSMLFTLTEEDAQIMASSLNLEEPLTDEQMARVRKGVAAGLEGWQEIMETAIREAVKA